MIHETEVIVNTTSNREERRKTMARKIKKEVRTATNEKVTLVFKREELEGALRTAQDFVEKKHLLPALKCARINTEADPVAGQNAVLSVTDFVTSWTKRIECAGSSADICVPAELLYKEVKALGGDVETVTLSIEGNAVVVNDRCAILTQPAKDFPDIQPAEGVSFEVKALAEKFARVASVASDEEVRYNINGVFFDFKNGKVVATDGHRIHFEDMDVAEAAGFIIPKKAALIAAKRAAGDDIKVGEKTVSLHVSGGVMVARFVDGEFPDYLKVVPKDNPVRIEFMSKSLLDIFNGALPFSEGNMKIVRLTINGAITVETSAPSLGSYKWQIPCMSLGKEKDIEIGFNAAYLADALKAFANDAPGVLELKDPLSPVLVNGKAVVMPVRLS